MIITVKTISPSLTHSLFMLRCRNRTQQKARKAISIKMYEIK